MVLIVGDLGFAEWRPRIELLRMILFVMLFVSVCCILSVRYIFGTSYVCSYTVIS